MRCYLKEWDVPEKRSESGREFQIVGAAVWKEREPEIRLVQGICYRRKKMAVASIC